MTAPITHSRAGRRLRAALTTLMAVLLAAVAASCTPAPKEVPDSVEIPDTRVGTQTAWVLGQLNADELGSEAEFMDRFDPSLLESVPLDELRSKLDELRAEKPWKAIEYDGTETECTVRIVAADTEFDLHVSVGADDRMSGLFFAAPEVESAPASSWEELRDALEREPYDASLQVTEKGTDAPMVSIGESGTAPVGSVFKLYVLGALTAAVAQGALTWDSQLTIDAQVRSLPTGELQDRPDGATVTVREAAEKMIAISDNTATDLLIRAVGRDAVTAAMHDMGHSDPGLNAPLLTTREFFWIGWGDARLRERWAAGDATERVALLKDVPAGLPDVDAVDWSVPAWESGVDWFATHDDIARAHLALQEKARTAAGAPIREILAANPGISLGAEWTYSGFKGGSATGVLAGSWYLEREEGRPVVITLLVRSADPAAIPDATAVFHYAEEAARLLAAEG